MISVYEVIKTLHYCFINHRIDDDEVDEFGKRAVHIVRCKEGATYSLVLLVRNIDTIHFVVVSSSI